MVQIRVGDVYLDLYEFDPPKLNFAIEDITDTSTRSEFTQTFRIPATSNNSNFFETAFDINGYDFDITQKINAELMIDGALFRQGELRLNNIYITRENEKIDYEVIFFSTTRSLATSIGEGTLNELDLSDLDHDMTTDNITLSWQAYPSGTTTSGLLNGDVLYPLVDFGNTYNGGGDVVEGEISNTEGTGRLPFTDQNNALERERFKPWVRVKKVWDTIFDEAGFTYTSEFLSGNTIRNLYLSAHGNEASIYTPALQNTGLGGGTGVDTGEEVFLTPTLDPGNNFSGGRYIVPITGGYSFRYQLIGEGTNALTSIDITLRIYKFAAGSTLLDSVTVTATPNDDGEFIFNLNDTTSASLTAGDEIYINFITSPTLDLDYQGTLEITDAPGQISISPLLPNDYKKIDFVRDIITKFRLVLAPDKNNSSNFIIEPWTTYIASGDEFDWTDKLDVSKDFKLSPIFYTQTAKIKFEDKEGGDEYNQLYFQQFEEVFGTLNTFSNNSLLDGEREIKTNSIPLIVTQIRGSEQANNGMDNTIIPQLNIHESEETGTQYIPVVSKNRFGFYNGMKNTGTISARNDAWFIESDGGGTESYTNYPMISPYSNFPLLASSIDFNWQREEGYIKYNLQDKDIGSSMYDAYWSTYINSLYDKWARRVTAYFVLNAQDLLDFSYDDVIFVKDTYYYVEKIYDVPLGEKASVKVDLIKLLNR
jgi:hypothetical protein